MLQVSRVFIRTRTLFFCHHPPTSSPKQRCFPIPGLHNQLYVVKEELQKPSFVRHFLAANGCKNPSTSINNAGYTGKRLGQILGLFVGSSYLSRNEGVTNTANCENDQENRWPSTSETVGENYQQSRVRRVAKRLWVPSLCVLTISLGWQYPVSLLLNLLFLMWSTKPNPSSVYSWVEQMRRQDAMNTSGLDRMKAQAAGVMHVEVRDNMLFCLARVTSLTKRSTVLGFMGDWWVIYSSSSAIHTGVRFRNLIPTVSPFMRE